MISTFLITLQLYVKWQFPPFGYLLVLHIYAMKALGIEFEKEKWLNDSSLL